MVLTQSFHYDMIYARPALGSSKCSDDCSQDAHMQSVNTTTAQQAHELPVRPCRKQCLPQPAIDLSIGLPHVCPQAICPTPDSANSNIPAEQCRIPRGRGTRSYCSSFCSSPAHG